MPGRLYEATWGRMFAFGYDWFLKGTEEAGLRDMRRELLSEASGKTLEVGAGTGANIELYPDSVSELVLSEPDRFMASKLRAKYPDREVVDAPAENLPFPDDSFDTVALTLVLCTVPDPPGALREIARVLRPGGKFLFLEHVRSEDPRVAKWQDRLHKPWRLFGDGCNCNRNTLATIEASPLSIEHTEDGELPKSPPLVRPLLRGAARA